MLKILLLNHSDSGGGAAIACERLLTALLNNKTEVTLGVIEKKISKSEIQIIKKKTWSDKNELCRILNKIYLKGTHYFRNKSGFGFKTSNPVFHSKNKKTIADIEYINNSDFDLIHLHWINNNMISIEDITKIKKPVVWTMHDAWVYCGAEHYPNILENDTRYIEGYSKNNKPKTTIGQDICRKTWKRKIKSWKNININFISPSNYIKESFESSAIFHNMKSTCTIIPNIIPDNIFKPNNKNSLKELYHIPLDKKVIGFGAAYDLTNKKSIKGGYLLLEALKKIQDKSNYHIVIFGNDDGTFSRDINFPVFATSFISNPFILSGIYNLCDVFVCPSLIESFGLVCLESLFCGVPVAAFNTGGIPDIIEHKKTGYLAECFNIEDLYNGILYCIENNKELSDNSILKARMDFNPEFILKKHIELYESVLNKQGNP